MGKELVIVTGGCGFVGSNLIQLLNSKGISNIIIIDNYDEIKFKNLQNLAFQDYITYTKGTDYISSQLSKILCQGYKLKGIFHIGANADVLIKNPDIMLEANYEHSKLYYELAQKHDCPLIYASSSAVYGNSPHCFVDEKYSDPHNIYAWSKWLFDKYVTGNKTDNKIVGLRLFNTFGKGEYHKGKNASLPYRFFDLIRKNGVIDLFSVEIQRDYIWVEDVVNVFYEAFENNDVNSGIYNLGPGNPISHKKLAEIVTTEFYNRNIFSRDTPLIKLIPMPEELTNCFQFHTEAKDINSWVSKYANNNEEKIKNYIQLLIAEYYENNQG